MRTAPLDPLLLSKPFGVQTKWYVLTGAACVGKTTMVNMLADQGYSIIPESAREYFDNELAKGRTLQQICQEGSTVQREIARLQISCERRSKPATEAFLDRALPDSLTFFRVFDMDPNEILPACFQHRYANVFILSRLPFGRRKTLGPEDEATSDFLDEWLVRDYSDLGYNVIRVPVLPPQERLAFILDHVSDPSISRLSSRNNPGVDR